MIKKIIPSLMKTLLRYRLLKILFACKIFFLSQGGMKEFHVSVCILVQEIPSIPTGTEHN